MGYRSKIRIATSEKGYERIVELEDALPEGRRLFGGNVRPDYESHDRVRQTAVIGWDDIKWFPEEYEQVEAFEQVLERLEEEGLPWKLARVGDDACDIEERDTGSNAWDLPVEVYVTTDIVVA